jgi:hypothetical protein
MSSDGGKQVGEKSDDFSDARDSFAEDADLVVKVLTILTVSSTASELTYLVTC